MPRQLKWLILVALAYAGVELASLGGLLLLDRARGVTYNPTGALARHDRETLEALLARAPSYFEPHPELGWSIRPGASTELYQANSVGLRAAREYDPHPPPGLLRVSTFGDSFTHADEVAHADTWQAVMEREKPALEVLNFGVPGYGPGQAYLRYQVLGRRFPADVVLIGFQSENIHRSVNRFRPFYTRAGGIPFSKPRFVLRGDELQLIANPLRSERDYRALIDNPEKVLGEIGVDDGHFGGRYYASPFDWSPTVRLTVLAVRTLSPDPASEKTYVTGVYNSNTEAFRVTRAILDAFYADVIADSATPVMVLFPNRADIEGRRRGRPAHYQPLIDHFERTGHRYIDLYKAFPEAHEVDDLLLEYHYSPLGNRLVAGLVLSHLETWLRTGPPADRRHFNGAR